jgi:FkbM family methyltransferase
MQRVATWIIAVSPEALRALWFRVRASPVGHRLARGTFWMVTGTVISRMLGLVSSIILARILGKVPFGELGTIQSTVGLFAAFAGLGIGITATKYVAEFRESETDRCGRVIGFSLGGALVGGILAGLGLVVFGGWLAADTLAAPQLGPLLRVGAGLVVFSSLQGAYLGALAGFEAFKQVCRVNWISSLVGVPLAVIATLWAGLDGAVWALVLQTILGCAYGHAALIKAAAQAGVKISFVLSPEEWSMLWRFTLPSFLSALLATPAGWFSRTMLVNQHGGYAEAALVSAANQWMNLVNFLPWTMGGVLVPIFANLYATGRRDEFMKLLRHNLALNVGVALSVALPLMICSSWILGCYGAGFGEGLPIFVVTMLCGVFVAINNLFSRAMQSAGRAWIDLTCTGLWAVVVIAGSWPLIHLYKGLGLVSTQVIAAVALLVWQWLIVIKLLRMANKAQPQPGTFLEKCARHGRSLRQFARTRDRFFYVYGRVLRRLSWPLPGRSSAVQVRLHGQHHPFHLRLSSTDWLVLEEIFNKDEYAFIADAVKNAGWIVDLGANVGYSLRYWQVLFPQAHIIAMEPEPGNYAICSRNISSSGLKNQVTLLQAGVGAVRGKMQMMDVGKGEWAYRTVESKNGQGKSVDILPLSEVLENHARGQKIDLLKCDIEGAEKDLFDDCRAWIGQINTIVIELHPPYGLEELLTALKKADANFEVVLQINRKLCPVVLLQRPRTFRKQA